MEQMANQQQSSSSGHCLQGWHVLNFSSIPVDIYSLDHPGAKHESHDTMLVLPPEIRETVFAAATSGLEAPRKTTPVFTLQ
jgi:hypothetical protein